MDPVIFRLVFVLLLIGGGAGLIVYIIAWIILPEATEEEELYYPAVPSTGSGATIIGAVLVGIGALILLQRFAPWVDARFMAGVILLGLGVALVVRGVRRG